MQHTFRIFEIRIVGAFLTFLNVNDNIISTFCFILL